MATQSEMMDSLVSSPTGVNWGELGHGRYFDLVNGLGEPTESIPTVLAVVLWQILIETKAYRDSCSRLNLKPVPWHERDMHVVGHGPSERLDADLLILDRSFGKAAFEVVKPTRSDLQTGVLNWKRSRRNQLKKLVQAERVSGDHVKRLTGLLDLIDRPFVNEALKSREFHVVATRTPDLIYTSVPQSPWSVVPQTSLAASATAGAIVRDKSDPKVSGVTIPAHLLLNGRIIDPKGWQVDVNGQTGKVVSCDVISDSCFVQLPIPILRKPAFARKITQGLIPGIAPGLGTTGYFEGCGSSGRQSGTISSVHVDVFLQDPLVQQSFRLNHLTNQGDSGAALLDASDFLLGFASCATAALSNPSYSSWIWANSVCSIHNATPY